MDTRPSLIQERHGINRVRIVGICLASLGGVLLIGEVLLAFVDSELHLDWYFPALAAFILLNGAMQLRSSRKLRLAFEAKHGADAGKQEPVT
ncbi:hypothetical protein [Glaciihabitans sp. dw_435]|uniref:hypothetical protein n=1 Tax=Glaciihabitans sp. dw_435 TaxID=2720081 RepID=UPI001BD6C191|nr:hypothetical protein [Glaciihabitans sp. dw_435]